MGRDLRIEVPGGAYHVTSRGNNKERIVWDGLDRGIFLEMLSRTAIRHSWTLLAYCLMTNHYHLVLRIDQGGLSAGVQRLNTAFAYTMNVRHERVGHLFQNRFHGGLLETDAHLLESVRYTVLNPVRAGLCEDPGDWPASSYRACAGLELPIRGLADGELLRLFGNQPARARRAYRDFVSEGHVPVSDTVTEV